MFMKLSVHRLAICRCIGRVALACLSVVIGFWLLLLPASAQIASNDPKAPDCSAIVGGLHFICGVVDAEDLVQIPGTRWLIASGYDPGGGLLAGSGLKLVDTESKTFSYFYSGSTTPVAREEFNYSQCTEAPPANLVTHGLYLAKAEQDRRFKLYAVTHVPRETVEIFTLDATGDIPTLLWSGCLTLPAGMKGNGVAVFSDGTVLVTVLNAPGLAASDGSSRGVVLRWSPGSRGFQPIPGTELPSNNGIELSKDEQEFYVVGFGNATVYVYSRNNPYAPVRSIKAPGFVPDNLRWSGDMLIATGPMYDEPACGGTRQQAQQTLGATARKPGGGCNRGYMAAALDPVAMTWKVLAYAEPNPQIGIISAGVIVDNTLYIGAALAPGLAYRTLPRPNIQ